MFLLKLWRVIPLTVSRGFGGSFLATLKPGFLSLGGRGGAAPMPMLLIGTLVGGLAGGGSGGGCGSEGSGEREGGGGGGLDVSENHSSMVITM